MRKIVYGALAAGVMVSSAAALEIYRDSANNAYVDIYGSLRGYLGYGNVQSNYLGKLDDGLLFGIQGNSRVGIKAGYGDFTTQVEIGANETTVYGSSSDNNIGLRQAWAAYSFGDAGTLLAGKTDTLTSMNGFSSDVFYNDGGGQGFGGLSTSTRRFQVQYKLPMGLSLAISENEAVGGQLYTGLAWRIPRISASYDIKTENMTAKIAATYAFVNQGKASFGNADDMHIFSIKAGVKPTFGNMWVSAMLSYGLNDTLTGEEGIGAPGMLSPVGNSHTIGGGYGYSLSPKNNSEGNGIDNLHRISALAEFGVNITSDFAALIGGGYQWANVESNPSSKGVSTYTIYVQTPLKLGQFFTISPQIGWYGINTGESFIDDGKSKKIRASSILAAAQLKFTF